MEQILAILRQLTGTASMLGNIPKPVKVVFVLNKEGKAEMREVKTGIASRTDIEIVDGILEGDKIVDGPYRTLARELQDGQAVQEQKKPEPNEKGDSKGPPGGRS